MKWIAVESLRPALPQPGSQPPPNLHMIPAMTAEPAGLKPKRWLAHLPLVILPLLAAAVIEGPRLKHDMEHRLAAALAAAGQGWAKVTVSGRDVEIRGAAPGQAAAGEARAVVTAQYGVRRVAMHVGTVLP